MYKRKSLRRNIGIAILFMAFGAFITVIVGSIVSDVSGRIFWSTMASCLLSGGIVWLLRE